MQTKVTRSHLVTTKLLSSYELDNGMVVTSNVEIDAGKMTEVL